MLGARSMVMELREYPKAEDTYHTNITTATMLLHPVAFKDPTRLSAMRVMVVGDQDES